MTQQLRHRADLEPRSQGLIWPTGGPEGCLPCCSPGHPISLSSLYCCLSPRQAVDRGHSPATIWLDTRSIWLDTHLILPLLESCSVPHLPQNKAQDHTAAYRRAPCSLQPHLLLLSPCSLRYRPTGLLASPGTHPPQDLCTCCSCLGLSLEVCISHSLASFGPTQTSWSPQGHPRPLFKMCNISPLSFLVPQAHPFQAPFSAVFSPKNFSSSDILYILLIYSLSHEYMRAGDSCFSPRIPTA